MVNVHKLTVWSKSIELVKMIYGLCEENIYLAKDFWLKGQIQRAAVSVPSNIAEWADRNTDKEFARFLYIARGSISELRTQIRIIKELDRITETQRQTLESATEEIHKMLNAFIKKIQ